MSETVTRMETIRFYLPEQAAHTPDVANKDVIDVLTARASRHYGGYSTFEGNGGWLPDDAAETVEEPITVVEVVADVTADVEPETFAKVNARWILDATDEQMVMVTVGNKVIRIE